MEAGFEVLYMPKVPPSVSVHFLLPSDEDVALPGLPSHLYVPSVMIMSYVSETVSELPLLNVFFIRVAMVMVSLHNTRDPN